MDVYEYHLWQDDHRMDVYEYHLWQDDHRMDVYEYLLPLWMIAVRMLLLGMHGRSQHPLSFMKTTSG